MIAKGLLNVAQNIDLWQRSLNHIHDNPQEWGQDDWGVEYDCGTAYCLFGTVVHLKSEDDLNVRFRWINDQVSEQVINIGKYGTEVTYISEYVSELFGITETQGVMLAHAGNTMAQLFGMSYVLTEREIKLPDEVYSVLRGTRAPTLFRPLNKADSYSITEIQMSPSKWAYEIEHARDRLHHAMS